jgi:exopolysaccharide production protein ExoZ
LKTIVPIQILRALAAIAVVFSHFNFDLSRTVGIQTALPDLHYGDAGVDLFFVISGFVMVYATEPYFARAGGSSTFFIHRLIRIVPIYWLVTLVYMLMALVVPVFGKNYSAGSVAASFFFIPYLRPENVIQPIVGQGWTLNYEMFFYVIFAFAVVATRRTAVIVATSVLMIAVIAGMVFAPLPMVIAFWSDSIILEFAFGMLIANAYRENVRLPKWAGASLIIAGALLFFFMSPRGPADPALRVVSWGIPAALVMAGATLAPFRPTSWPSYALAEAGDASYALYLTHSFPIRAVLYLALAVGIDPARIAWLLLAIAVVSAILLSILIYSLLERPVTRSFR